jgi:hypothetical protein
VENGADFLVLKFLFGFSLKGDLRDHVAVCVVGRSVKLLLLLASTVNLVFGSRWDA